MSTLSQNADWIRAAADRVAAQGFPVRWESGWATRHNDSSLAVLSHEAIVVHHTGATTTSTAYLRDGEKARTMKPPYAHIHVPRDGALVIIAAGGASHAGNVDRAVWDRIVSGTAPLDRDLAPGADSKTFSANRPGLGIEVNGAGGPGDWTAEQRAVVVAFCAAYHAVRGWPAPRVGAHKELTRRKPGDPYAPMGALRTDIKNRNITQEEDMPSLDEIRQIVREEAGWQGPGAPMITNLYSGGSEWPATALGALQRRLVVESLGPILAAAISAVGEGLDGDQIAAKVQASVTTALGESTASLQAIAQQMRDTIDTAGDQIATDAREKLTAQLSQITAALTVKEA